MRLDEIGQTLDPGDELVIPQRQIADGAATAPVDLGAFDEHQPRAAGGEPADIHQVPVGGKAVVGGVLVHRRDADPIFHGDAADGQRLKQFGVRHGQKLSR